MDSESHLMCRSIKEECGDAPTSGGIPSRKTCRRNEIQTAKCPVTSGDSVFEGRDRFQFRGGVPPLKHERFDRSI